MNDGAVLVSMNIHFLEQGLALLNNIEDELFTKRDSNLHKSSVAKHLRHALEHYQTLIESRDGRLDYDDRERDDRLESDRNYAIETIQHIIVGLKKYVNDGEFKDKPLRIKNNEADRIHPDAWSDSSLKRELQFLISHTVHHYALIAVILRIYGYHPNEEFGIAPSTLRYQEQARKEAAG